MRLSIITINYNNPIGLEETILSVINQTNRNFEYVIVDGGSTKGDVNIIKKYDNEITKWISEPDSGIYNAMNKAVKMCNGEYCLFMNSGDTLYCNTTVDEIFQHTFTEDFVEGIITFKNRPGVFHFPVKDLNLSYFIYVTNNYHQASLIKRKMLLDNPYDETYRIAADMKFNMQCIINHNCSYRGINVVISIYECNGLSMTVNHDEEIRRIFEDLIPYRIIRDYEEHEFLHVWPFFKVYPKLQTLCTNPRLYSVILNICKLLGKKPSENQIRYLEKLKRNKNNEIYSSNRYYDNIKLS